MIEQIKKWLAPPLFPGDEEKTRLASLLNTTTLICILFLGLTVPILWLGGEIPSHVVLINSAAILLLIAVRILLRRGRIAPASTGLLIVAFAWITTVSLTQGTVRAPATATYVFVIILAGSLFGWNGILWVSIVSSLAVFGLIQMESAGLLPTPNHSISFVQWITYTCLFAVTGSLSIYTNQVTRNSLGQAEKEIVRRKLAEQELRKLSRAVEQSPASIMITNLTGNIEYVNPRFTQLTGYTFEEVRGKNPRFLKTELTQSGTHDQMWKSLSSGQEWRGEFVNRKKDGTVFYESATISPITDPAGAPTHYLAVKEDITARVESEQALRESEAMFRLMFERHAAIMLLVDPMSGWILDANLAAEKFYGYSREELKSMHIEEINLLPRQDVYQARKRALQGETNLFVFPHRLANGEIRTVEVHSSPLVVYGQSLLFSIIHDITEREKFEADLRASEAQFRSLFEQNHDGVFILGLDEHPLDANQRAAEMIGYTLEEIRQFKGREFMVAQRVNEFAFKRVVAGEHIPIIERTLRRKNGATFPVEINLELVRDGQGHPLHVQAIVRDISERKQAEAARLESEKRYRSLFDQTHDAIFILDFSGRHLDANQRAADMLGYTREEINMLSANDLSGEPEKSQDTLRRMLAGESIPLYERLFRRKDGQLFPVEINVEMVFDAAGKPLHIQSVVRDISERKQTEEALRIANDQLQQRIRDVEKLRDELHEQALHDPLTGLYNRRYLSEALRRETRRAHREKRLLSVIAMDIDHFKKLNDTYGHQAGDLALQEVASLIKKSARGYDFVCRYGGEEFLLVLPGANAGDACIRVDDIRERCSSLVIAHNGKELHLTISMGVATYPDDDADMEKVINKADQALYRSKETGRDRVTAWNSQLAQE